MSIAAPLMVLVGISSLWWLLSRNERKRVNGEPRGRRLNHSEGTGLWPRSLSRVSTSTNKPTGTTNVVLHEEKPYWKRRGWKKQGTDLTGYYRTKYGTFKGKIKDYQSDPKVFIYNPPKQLNNHDHSHCFFSKGGGKYQVHFKHKVDKPSISIQSVEKILRESFQQS